MGRRIDLKSAEKVPTRKKTENSFQSMLKSNWYQTIRQ